MWTAIGTWAVKLLETLKTSGERKADKKESRIKLAVDEFDTTSLQHIPEQYRIARLQRAVAIAKLQTASEVREAIRILDLKHPQKK